MNMHLKVWSEKEKKVANCKLYPIQQINDEYCISLLGLLKQNTRDCWLNWQMYFLTSSEAKSLRSRCWQVCFKASLLSLQPSWSMLSWSFSQMLTSLVSQFLFIRKPVILDQG